METLCLKLKRVKLRNLRGRGMSKRVDITSVTEQYGAIGKKFLLEARDVEFIFYQTLCTFFDASDVAIESEGVRINGKYRNIRFDDFGKIINNFNIECNNRSFYKKESYVLSFFATNNNVVYGKIVDRDSYSYTFQPMLSKGSELRYVSPIKIERDGEMIPEYISMLPIEIYPASIKRNEKKNLFGFSAKILTKRTAEVHLKRVSKKLEKEFSVLTQIVFKSHDHKKDVLYLKDVSKSRKLHYAIVKYYMKYFGMFGVKTVIDTKIVRK